MILYELEFRFLNGTLEVYQVQDGRDTVSIDDRAVRIELHPGPDLMEEVVIFHAALASRRTIRSEVEDAPPADAPRAVVEAGGTLRVTG